MGLSRNQHPPYLVDPPVEKLQVSLSMGLNYGMVHEATRQWFRRLTLSAAMSSVKVPSKDLIGLDPVVSTHRT